VSVNPEESVWHNLYNSFLQRNNRKLVQKTQTLCTFVPRTHNSGEEDLLQKEVDKKLNVEKNNEKCYAEKEKRHRQLDRRISKITISVLLQIFQNMLSKSEGEDNIRGDWNLLR